MSEECNKDDGKGCCSSKKGCCTQNVCGIDRLIRAIVGLALLAFAVGIVGGDATYRWIGWFGAIPLISSIIGFCPGYLLIKRSGCCKKDNCEDGSKASCCSKKGDEKISSEAKKDEEKA